MSEKDSDTDTKDIEKVGLPPWALISLVSNKKARYAEATRAMAVSTGVVLRVSTQQNTNVTEALCFVPRATLKQVGERDGEQLWEIC